MQEMQETPVRSLGGEDPLEEGMATHSSILAWRIPWTEEPGRLQSMGSHRVGHDWAHACQTDERHQTREVALKGWEKALAHMTWNSWWQLSMDDSVEPSDHLPSPACFWESPCSRNTRNSGAFLVYAHSISPATGWSRLTPLTELNPLNPSLLSSQIKESRRSLRCNDNSTLHNQVPSDPYNTLQEWGGFSHPQFADEVTEAEKAVTGLKPWHGADSGAWSHTFQYSSGRMQKALAATWQPEIPSVGHCWVSCCCCSGSFLLTWPRLRSPN